MILERIIMNHLQRPRVLKETQPCVLSPTHIYYSEFWHSLAISTSINHSCCYRESLSPPVCILYGFLKSVGMLGEKTRLTKLQCINLLSQHVLKQRISKLLVTAKRCTQHMAHCFNERVWHPVKGAWPLARMQTCTFMGWDASDRGKGSGGVLSPTAIFL